MGTGFLSSWGHENVLKLIVMMIANSVNILKPLNYVLQKGDGM